jgi:hypothetical protein
MTGENIILLEFETLIMHPKIFYAENKLKILAYIQE